MRQETIGICFALGLLLAAGCHQQAKPGEKASQSPSQPVTADGGTKERAIVIHAKNEEEGMNAEYGWLRQHYPGYQMVKQALMGGDKKFYDFMTFKTPNGKTLELYFDITEYFGTL